MSPPNWRPIRLDLNMLLNAQSLGDENRAVLSVVVACRPHIAVLVANNGIPNTIVLEIA